MEPVNYDEWLRRGEVVKREPRQRSFGKGRTPLLQLKADEWPVPKCCEGRTSPATPNGRFQQ
jgi:hypothetical protein